MCCILKRQETANGLIFQDELNVDHGADQQSSSYEGIEDILRGLQDSERTRLNANVNFDLTMELLFLTIKENLVE